MLEHRLGAACILDRASDSDALLVSRLDVAPLLGHELLLCSGGAGSEGVVAAGVLALKPPVDQYKSMEWMLTVPTHRNGHWPLSGRLQHLDHCVREALLEERIFGLLHHPLHCLNPLTLLGTHPGQSTVDLSTVIVYYWMQGALRKKK